MIKRMLRLLLCLLMALPLISIASLITTVEGIIIIPAIYVVTGKWHYDDYKTTLQTVAGWIYKIVKEERK